jgi:phage-related holin
MKKFAGSIILSLSMMGFVGGIIINPNVAVANDVDKILKAKEIVRNMVNYPDTLVFYEFYTKVSGNVVTLKFTAKNGFGVPETFVKDIKVN